MMKKLSREEILNSFPQGGLFADRNWLLTPVPLQLSRKRVREIERMGYWLLRWQRSQEELYLRSAKGKTLDPWLARVLDAGKPDWLVELGRAPALTGMRPEVIRPDLLLGDDGFAITELDSVPGGMGVTLWLSQLFARAGWDVLGGADGMVQGFGSLFEHVQGRGKVFVSEESGDYRPEMEWMAQLLNERGYGIEVEDAESGSLQAGEFGYRFYELFDWENLGQSVELMQRAGWGEVMLSSPPRAFYEEKMWAAMLWTKVLERDWILSLRKSRFEGLKRMVPRAWMMNPMELPYLAEHPQLGVVDLHAVGGFSQKERELVLKISGFSELAWGSKGVMIGSDEPSAVWQAAVDEALAQWDTQPYLLQRFAPTTLVKHPYYDPDSGELREMEGRVRVCPYFFADGSATGPRLGGVMATIVPADKKKIHGMKDGILCPVVMAQD